MTQIVAIVEGYGDVQAIPALVARIGLKFGVETIAPKPIRAGEWKSLLQPGKLEKNLDLAASRQASRIIVILDLDDGCEKDECAAFDNRVENWKGGRTINVDVVFFAREYETIFLQCPSCLSRYDETKLPSKPVNIRGAKEKIKQMIGRRYRETQDQLAFTRLLDLETALEKSRPFQRLCRLLTNRTYEDLGVFRALSAEPGIAG